MLGEVGSGQAEWQVEDPAAVGLSWAKGRLPRPFAEVQAVETRSVRFKEEAFEGMDADIILVVCEQTRTEIALSRQQTGPVYDRLRGLLPS